MDLSNESLGKIQEQKNLYNKRYSRYFYRLYKEMNDNSFLERSRRIGSCMDFWNWDKYELNKILDLKTVNRCNNNRFCPNCKKLDVSKFIHKFKDIVVDYSDYHYYFLTLTVPNCKGEDLPLILDKLNSCFAKLKEKLSYDLLTPSGKVNKKAFQDRLLKLDGGIRVLEINYNGARGYHPHLHCVVLCKDNPDDKDMKKVNQGRFSKKRKQIDYKSNIEVQIGKLWSMIWHDEEISLERYYDIDYIPSNNYYDDDKKVLEVDFKEFTEKGVYEVFKYTFKDKDITNFHVFKTLYFSLFGKRIRQGFGCLYNVKVENIEVGEQQPLELEFDELGTDLITNSINELLSTYKDYKKISRFNTQLDNNIK